MYQVLLVDDEPAGIEKERAVIEKKVSDFNVSGIAYSTNRAKEIISETHIDIVITDICMSGEDGIELLRYINESDKNIICIAVSGYSDFSYVHDAFINGAADYLLKPIDEEKILHILERAEKYYKKKDDSAIFAGLKLNETLYRNICNFIETNIRGDNSSLQICAEFGISQSQLGRIFKKYSKKTFNDYLISIRIEKAKEILEYDDECYIGEVASRVGYEDQYYFSKVFKKYTGITPRDFRNKSRASQE